MAALAVWSRLVALGRSQIKKNILGSSLGLSVSCFPDFPLCQRDSRDPRKRESVLNWFQKKKKEKKTPKNREKEPGQTVLYEQQ
jgi:hypothetical protein